MNGIKQQKLVAAVLNEGSFSLDTAIAAWDVSKRVGHFEKKYGIKVKIFKQSISLREE